MHFDRHVGIVSFRYYPFGLVMGGISSKALSFGKENRRKFNEGTELNTDLGLDWYETMFRGYDAQIGRFLQIDPLAMSSPPLSPYAYVMNNPLLFNDPWGLDTVRVNGAGSHRIQVRQGDVLAWTIGKTTSYYTYDPNNADAVNGFVGGGIDGGDLPVVTVTVTKKNNSSFLPSLLASEGYGVFRNTVDYSGIGMDIYKTRQSLFNPAISAYRNNQFLATYKGQTKAFSLTFKGNQYLSSYQVNVMKWKFLDSKAITTFKALEKTGFKLNLLGTGMIALDVSQNGFTVENSHDAFFNGIGYLGLPGTVISSAYSIVKLGIPSDPAERQKLAEGDLKGQIVHPYQIMPGLGPAPQRQ